MQCKDIPDLEVLRLAADRDGLCVYEKLVAKYGHEKVCWTKINRLVDRDLLEYGTTARWAWPTEKGERMLQEVA